MKFIISRFYNSPPLKKSAFVIFVLSLILFSISIAKNGFYYEQPPISKPYLYEEAEGNKNPPVLFIKNWYCAELNNNGEIEFEAYGAHAKVFVPDKKNEKSIEDPRNLYKVGFTIIDNPYFIFYYQDSQTKEKKILKITGKRGHYDAVNNTAFVKGHVYIEQTDDGNISTDEAKFFIKDGFLYLPSRFVLNKENSKLEGLSLNLELKNEKYFVTGPVKLHIQGEVVSAIENKQESNSQTSTNDFTILTADGSSILERTYFQKLNDENVLKHFTITTSKNVVLHSKNEKEKQEITIRSQYLQILFEKNETLQKNFYKILELIAKTDNQQPVVLLTNDSEVSSDSIYYKFISKNLQTADFTGDNLKVVLKNFQKTSFLSRKQKQAEQKTDLTIESFDSFSATRDKEVVSLYFPNKSHTVSDNFRLDADKLRIEVLSDKREPTIIDAQNNVSLIEEKSSASADNFLWNYKNKTLSLSSINVASLKNEDFQSSSKEIVFDEENRIIKLSGNCSTIIFSNSSLNKNFGILSSYEKNKIKQDEVSESVTIISENQDLFIHEDSNSLKKFQATKNVSIKTKTHNFTAGKFYWNETENYGFFSKVSSEDKNIIINSDNSFIECNYVFINGSNSEFNVSGLKKMKLVIEKKPDDVSKNSQSEEIEVYGMGVLLLEENLIRVFGNSIIFMKNNTIKADYFSMNFSNDKGVSTLINLYTRGNVFIKGENNNACGDSAVWDYTNDIVVIRGLPYAQMFRQDSYILASEITMKSDWSSFQATAPRGSRVNIIQIEKVNK